MWNFFKKKIVDLPDTIPLAKPKLHVTLWPSFPHFPAFFKDERLAGIRLNSAMMNGAELDSELSTLQGKKGVPLYFDIKGRQLRVTKVYISSDHLEVDLNHAIEVETPTVVLFKAGGDQAFLKKVDGNHLVFDGGPQYMVKEGESLHIRHESLVVHEPIFTDFELQKIEKVVKAGFKKFYLSYVEDNKEVEQFRSMIGMDSELILKIESKKGLDFVQNKFVKTLNTRLMAARGDLFVELDKPHEILNAVKMIVKKDPDAFVGSRILLSVIHSPVPECDDFSDLAWLRDIGYKNFLLCDELCLKGDLLQRAVNVFEAFRTNYGT